MECTDSGPLVTFNDLKKGFTRVDRRGLSSACSAVRDSHTSGIPTAANKSQHDMKGLTFEMAGDPINGRDSVPDCGRVG